MKGPPRLHRSRLLRHRSFLRQDEYPCKNIQVLCRTTCCVRSSLRIMRSNIQADSAYSDERLIELCEILAAGLMRLRARQSSTLSADRRDSSLDFTRRQSGPADPKSLEVEA